MTSAGRLHRLRRIAYAAMLACTALDLVLAPFARFDPLANSVIRATLAMAVGFGLASAALRWVRPRVEPGLTLPWLAPALAVAESGCELLMFYGWLPVGITVAEQLVLRGSLALADPWLAAVDEAVGLAHPVTHRWFDQLGVLPALAVVYDSVQWQLPLVFGALVLVRRDLERAWEYVAVVAVAGAASVAAIWAVPAFGPRGWYGPAPYASPPAEPAWVAELVALRAGQAPDPDHLYGLLTFPSFHVVFALLLARAMRGHGVLSAVVYGWNALVVVSAVPIGSHYLADVVGGIAWTAASAWLVERWCRVGRDPRRPARSADPQPDPSGEPAV